MGWALGSIAATAWSSTNNAIAAGALGFSAAAGSSMNISVASRAIVLLEGRRKPALLRPGGPEIRVGPRSAAAHTSPRLAKALRSLRRLARRATAVEHEDGVVVLRLDVVEPAVGASAVVKTPVVEEEDGAVAEELHVRAGVVEQGRPASAPCRAPRAAASTAAGPPGRAADTAAATSSRSTPVK